MKLPNELLKKIAKGEYVDFRNWLKNNRVEVLDLSGIRMSWFLYTPGMLSLKHIGLALQVTKVLSINLLKNCIPYKDAQEFANYISATSLEEVKINLNFNRLINQSWSGGCQELATALEKNKLKNRINCLTPYYMTALTLLPQQTKDKYLPNANIKASNKGTELLCAGGIFMHAPNEVKFNILSFLPLMNVDKMGNLFKQVVERHPAGIEENPSIFSRIMGMGFFNIFSAAPQPSTDSRKRKIGDTNGPGETAPDAKRHKPQ